MSAPPAVPEVVITEVTPLTRIRAAHRALRERAVRTHGDARAHTLVIEAGQAGLFWLAIAVGLALVATRVLWDDLVGQVVEVEGIGGLWHALLTAPSSADAPRVEVQDLRTIARAAADRREPLAVTPDGTTVVHVDAWELLAALVDLPPRAVLATALIGHAAAPRRWVRFSIVSGGSWGVVAVPEIPAQDRQSDEQLPLPGVRAVAPAPSLARATPRHWSAAVAPIVEVR